MKTVSIIGMILSILIIVGALAVMAIAYAEYQDSISGFGPFGGMVRHMDYQPYILGVVFGAVLLVLSIVGIAVSEKQPRPIVNVYSPPAASPNNAYPGHVVSPAVTYQQGTDEVRYLISQAAQSYTSRDYGGAIAILNRAVAISPTDNAVHFNLAILYSLTQQKQAAFNALITAINYGYTNFEKIRVTPDLQWLREQPEYPGFVNSGYRHVNIQQAATTKKTEPGQEDVIEKLEKLAKLKEQGLITEQEFNSQKERILNQVQ